jgi:hypothetical protein
LPGAKKPKNKRRGFRDRNYPCHPVAFKLQYITRENNPLIFIVAFFPNLCYSITVTGQFGEGNVDNGETDKR